MDLDFWGAHKPHEESERLDILVYGQPGVGKTSLAGTAEDDDRTSPVLFLDSEGGETTISYRGRALLVRTIYDYDEDMGDILNKLDQAKQRGELPFKTIVIDSLTVLIDKAMDAVMRNNAIKRANPSTPEYPDWNIWTNRMRMLMKRLKNLDVNLIATALEAPDDSGHYGPMYKGKKIVPVFTGGFNTVGRLYVATDGKTEQRRLLVQGNNLYVAKDRSDPLGVLPREVEEPTVAKLIDRMVEGRRAAKTRNDSRLETREQEVS